MEPNFLVLCPRVNQRIYRNMLKFRMLQVNSNGHSGVGLLADKVASDCVW